MSCRTDIQGFLLRMAEVDDPLKSEMWNLYASYYEGVSLEQFRIDLSMKQYCVLLRRESGDVAGFSTIEVYETIIDSQPARIIFSGDTIIDPAFWGSQILPRIWCNFAGTLYRADPEIPLYWFLIVQGHRTYRYLNCFSKTYFPSLQHVAPESAQGIMHHVASRKFGARYCAARGVVEFQEGGARLKGAWIGIDETKSRNPEVAFFLRANPDFHRGDELVCLTHLHPANLRPRAREWFALPPLDVL